MLVDNMVFVSIHLQIPNHNLAHLPERLLLFRHDYESQNILQLLNAVSDVTDETLIEIILNSSRKYFVKEKNNYLLIPPVDKIKITHCTHER